MVLLPLSLSLPHIVSSGTELRDAVERRQAALEGWPSAAAERSPQIACLYVVSQAQAVAVLCTCRGVGGASPAEHSSVSPPESTLSALSRASLSSGSTHQGTSVPCILSREPHKPLKSFSILCSEKLKGTPNVPSPSPHPIPSLTSCPQRSPRQNQEPASRIRPEAAGGRVSSLQFPSVWCPRFFPHLFKPSAIFQGQRLYLSWLNMDSDSKDAPVFSPNPEFLTIPYPGAAASGCIGFLVGSIWVGRRLW